MGNAGTTNACTPAPPTQHIAATVEVFMSSGFRTSYELNNEVRVRACRLCDRPESTCILRGLQDMLDALVCRNSTIIMFEHKMAHAQPEAICCLGASSQRVRGSCGIALIKHGKKGDNTAGPAAGLSHVAFAVGVRCSLLLLLHRCGLALRFTTSTSAPASPSASTSDNQSCVPAKVP